MVRMVDVAFGREDVGGVLNDDAVGPDVADDACQVPAQDHCRFQRAILVIQKAHVLHTDGPCRL